jgi:hypothetical protein
MFPAPRSQSAIIAGGEGAAIACPKCGYERKPSDTAPDWQCPACGIAMEKYRAHLAEAQHSGVAQATEVKYPPRAPLALRLAAAAPDLATSALFFWCWKSPLAWRATLVSELSTVMFIEFFTMHSGWFLAAANPKASVAQRLGWGLLILAMYSPFIAVFTVVERDWWPMAAFAWLLLGRVIAMAGAAGSGEFQRNRQWFYAGSSIAYYVLFGFLMLVILPVPGLGIGAGHFPRGRWTMPIYHVIAWGAFYFGAMGLTRLFEKPQWIMDTKTGEAE